MHTEVAPVVIKSAANEPQAGKALLLSGVAHAVWGLAGAVLGGVCGYTAAYVCSTFAATKKCFKAVPCVARGLHVYLQLLGRAVADTARVVAWRRGGGAA